MQVNLCLLKDFPRRHQPPVAGRMLATRLFSELPRRVLLGNWASGIPSSGKLKTLEGIEKRGRVSLLCQGKSEKRSPGPSLTSYPPPKELRPQFYTFVIR